MKITIYKCTKCQRERVEHDNAFNVLSNSVVKPEYETIYDVCLPCMRIEKLNNERKATLEEKLKKLRDEYVKATPDRQKQIKAMADSLKKDAVFANDVIDNLM